MSMVDTHRLKLTLPIRYDGCWGDDEACGPGLIRWWQDATFAPLRSILKVRYMISPSVDIAFIPVFLHDRRQKRQHLYGLTLREQKDQPRRRKKKSAFELTRPMSSPSNPPCPLLYSSQKNITPSLWYSRRYVLIDPGTTMPLRLSNIRGPRGV